MTTAAEGEELTRVGSGTPMGNLMRHYWMPALKSSELVANGAPVRSGVYWARLTDTATTPARLLLVQR